MSLLLKQYIAKNAPKKRTVAAMEDSEWEGAVPDSDYSELVELATEANNEIAAASSAVDELTARRDALTETKDELDALSENKSLDESHLLFAEIITDLVSANTGYTSTELLPGLESYDESEKSISTSRIVAALEAYDSGIATNLKRKLSAMSDSFKSNEKRIINIKKRIKSLHDEAVKLGEVYDDTDVRVGARGAKFLRTTKATKLSELNKELKESVDSSKKVYIEAPDKIIAIKDKLFDALVNFSKSAEGTKEKIDGLNAFSETVYDELDAVLREYFNNTINPIGGGKFEIFDEDGVEESVYVHLEPNVKPEYVKNSELLVESKDEILAMLEHALLLTDSVSEYLGKFDKAITVSKKLNDSPEFKLSLKAKGMKLTGNILTIGGFVSFLTIVGWLPGLLAILLGSATSTHAEENGSEIARKDIKPFINLAETVVGTVQGIYTANNISTKAVDGLDALLDFAENSIDAVKKQKPKKAE